MSGDFEAAAQRPPFFWLRAPAAGVVLGAALLLGPGGPARAEVIDGVAAVVGGEAIPRSKVDQAWLALAKSPGGSGPQSRDALLTRMIDVRVQLQRARALGLEANAQDVEEALTHIMADNHVPSLDALARALEAEGRTIEDLRRELRDQITVLRLVQHEVTSKLRPGPEALRAYYDAHPDRFATGRSIRVRQIVFHTTGLDDDARAKVAAAAGALRAKVDGPDAFRRAEARLAGSPGVTVGAAGTLDEAELRPELARVLPGLAAGQVSPPVALPDGWALFLVEAKGPGTPIPFGEALPEVQKAATDEAARTGGARWLARLKRETYIEVRDMDAAPAPTAAEAAGAAVPAVAPAPAEAPAPGTQAP